MQDARRAPRPRWAATALLGLAAMACSSLAAAQDLTAKQDAFVREMAAAADLSASDSTGEACRAVRRLRKDAVFDTLPPEAKAAVQADAGYVFLRCDKPAEALPELKAATAVVPEYWSTANLAAAGESLKDWDVAAGALIELAGRWPDKLNDEWATLAWRAFHGMKGRPERQIQLFQALFDARYETTSGDGSAMWLELARMYLDAGDTDRARQAASRVVGGALVVQMRIDRRFDRIVVRDARAFDARASAEKLVDKLRRQSLANPRDMNVWIQLTYALLAVGDHQAVIDEATRVLEAVAPTNGGKGDPQKWKDADDYVWVLNNRAIAHARMGNVDAAIADLRRAAAERENGVPNISQTLNLGSLLCSAGRRDEAARQVDIRSEFMTPFGRMVQATVLLCAAAQRGDRSEVEKIATYIQRNAEPMHATTLLESYLWSGDVPAAERVYIGMLTDPDQRGDALEFAQMGNHMPGMTGRAIFNRNRAELLARPAVVAKINEVGRVEKVDLFLDLGFE